MVVIGASTSAAPASLEGAGSQLEHHLQPWGGICLPQEPVPCPAGLCDAQGPVLVLSMLLDRSQSCALMPEFTGSEWSRWSWETSVRLTSLSKDMSFDHLKLRGLSCLLQRGGCKSQV